MKPARATKGVARKSDAAPRAAPRPRDEAVGQVLGVLVAGVVFLATIGTVLWTTRNASVDHDTVEAAGQRAQAEALVSLLVGSEGAGWDAGPDAVARMGLLDDGGGLSLSKMDSLRGVQLETTLGNGLMDYEEARTSLGIGGAAGAADFHLRVYPVGLGTAVLQSDLSHLRTAYVGDWVVLATAVVGIGTQEQMSGSARTQLDLTMASGTYEERAMLDDLGLGFGDRMHITTGFPNVLVQVAPLVHVPITDLVDETLLDGDVYPDDKEYLKGALAGRLDEYDVLVIGSGVQHNALNDGTTKAAIESWVFGGGMLIVLGSASANNQWLQPLFHVSTTTANGAPYVGDITHPLLSTPHVLDWEGFGTGGAKWSLPTTGSYAAFDSFSHVVMADGKDILAVSNEGAYGDGRIFLTSYMPRDLSGGSGQDLLHNMILYADREHLFLDYGPPVPDGVTVAAAVRHTYVIDDDIGQVPMRIEVLVWRS